VLAPGVYGSVTTTGPPERPAQEGLDARRNRGAHVDERAREERWKSATADRSARTSCVYATRA
jgi:hypothetical protein